MSQSALTAGVNLGCLWLEFAMFLLISIPFYVLFTHRLLSALYGDDLVLGRKPGCRLSEGRPMRLVAGREARGSLHHWPLINPERY